MSAGAIREFEAFVSALKRTENPYSPALQEKCVIREYDLFEYPLGDRFYLLWKVHSTPLLHSELEFEMEVFLLSIERKKR
jgi:hypothetical protein